MTNRQKMVAYPFANLEEPNSGERNGNRKAYRLISGLLLAGDHWSSDRFPSTAVHLFVVNSWGAFLVKKQQSNENMAKPTMRSGRIKLAQSDRPNKSYCLDVRCFSYAAVLRCSRRLEIFFLDAPQHGRRSRLGENSLSLKLVDSVLLVNSLTSIEMSYPYIRCAHPLYPKYSLEHLENGVFPIHISLRDTLMTFSQSQQLCVS
ncbi:hypothetical protein M513_09093 [Trichuris suis]|uniref:Uncharacterized protein n=1 Tax=Trichuris suis TaxID=68888 RepID=A0A085LYF4_9BILA|nr:hypothetical protein M513_09093 [Trichuris suis]